MTTIFHWRRILVSVSIIVAGVVVLAMGLRGMAGATESRSWPRVQGQVVASSVEQTRGGSGGVRSSGYKPRVEYTYTVNGTLHHGHRIAFGDDVSKTRSHAQQIAGAYPVGHGVEVAYDPNDPASSVLEPGFTGSAMLMPGIGAALLLAGVVTLAVNRKKTPADVFAP